MSRLFSLGLSNQQLRTIKDLRARADVRFEKVRVVFGLKTDGVANALGAWRGRSGCRYAVKCIPLCIANVYDLTGTAVVAAALGDDGSVSLVGATADCANPAAWLAEMKAAGAVELHIHSLSTFADARAAIVADLTDALGVREAA